MSQRDRPDGSGTSQTSTSSASPPEPDPDIDIWLDRARTTGLDELDRIRSAAEKWRNGAVALAGLITSVIILRPASDVTSYRGVTGWLAAAAIVALLGGGLAAMRAAFGLPLKRGLLTAERLREWHRTEAALAVKMLVASQTLFFAGVILAAASAGFAYAGSSPRNSGELRLVTVSGGPTLCGSIHYLGTTLRLVAGDGTVRVLALTKVASISDVASC